MPDIVANSVLPARRHPVPLLTQDGIRLVGEWSLPESDDPRAVIVFCHPLSTHGGSSDSHLIRKAAWRLPALAGIGVLRFNFRGVTSSLGTSEGEFEGNAGEGQDLHAALDEVMQQGFATDPWAVGWSFGTDVILRWGNVDPVAGVVLLSPPGRWSNDVDVAAWVGAGRPIHAYVPELDEFAPPPMVQQRFATVPEATVTGVDGAAHLWVGEKYARIALDGIVASVLPDAAPLSTSWDGPMQRWDDLRGFARMDDQA